MLSMALSWMFQRNKRIIPSKDDVWKSWQGESSTNETFLPKEFTVLVWNIEKGKEISFANELLRLSQNKHILMIQEYLNASHINHALPEIMRYDLATSFMYVDDEQQQQQQRPPIRTGAVTGSVIATPTRIECSITKDVEPIVHTPKATILSWIPCFGNSNESNKKQQELLVINIHGRNRGGMEPLLQQLQQIVPYLETHEGPILWAGDFNTNSVAKTESVQEFMKQFQLEPVHFHPDDRTRSKLSRQPLDWVFVRGIHVQKSSVPFSDGSDHQPMVLTLQCIF